MMIHKLTEIVVCNSDRLFSWVESEHCFPSHGPQQKVIDCTYAKTLLKNEIEQMSIWPDHENSAHHGCISTQTMQCTGEDV